MWTMWAIKKILFVAHTFAWTFAVGPPHPPPSQKQFTIQPGAICLQSNTLVGGNVDYVHTHRWLVIAWRVAMWP